MARLTRRKLVLLTSALALVTMVLIVLGGITWVTQSQSGRDIVRQLVLTQVAPRVHGKLYVGRIGGGLFGDVTIDSIEIRAADDTVFLATGPVRVTFDPRDLLDKRILLTSVDVRRPYVHIKKMPDGQWNWRHIFPEGKKGPPSVGRSFGDYIVIDSTVVHDGAVTLTLPWSPNDSLKGVKRDSAIAVNLKDSLAGIHREGRGFMRSWRWKGATASAGYVRLSHPDSIGQLFSVRRADIVESYPPFRFTNLRAQVFRLGDSVWVDASHFDLPRSSGRAKGKLVWGGPYPMRYDFHVVSDNVAMSDIAWIYPTLPTTGGGRMDLYIRNERNLDIIDYALVNMDVRSTKSRLIGNMTFGVGGPVLIVKDVALRADSVDFDLLRTLNGKEFPYDWQGKLVGTVRASGGPVNRFRIEDANFRYVDKHVPGAISSARARGEIDILFPAFTAFHALAVDDARVDLRTIEFINPEFPPLGGYITGRAVLDSSWLDVRFRDADVLHVDGPGPPSHFTGSGRVTWGEKYMTYDVAVTADPLSFPTLVRSYPTMPFRGLFAGPLTIKGQADALTVHADLSGAGGHLVYDGLVDADSSVYGARGDLRYESLDLQSLFGVATLPRTSLNGRAELDVRGDSLANLAGRVDALLDRSLADGVRVFPSHASMRFANAMVTIDSLRIETAAAVVRAMGGFGLAATTSDSLRFAVRIDSLGGLRRWLATKIDTTKIDSLSGSLTSTGVLVGNVKTAALSADLNGKDIVRNDTRVTSVFGQVDVQDIFGELSGNGSVTLDTLRVGTLLYTTASLESHFIDPRRATFAALLKGANATQATATGLLTQQDSGRYDVRLDTLRVLADKDVWNLERAGHLITGPEGTSTDSLVLRARDGGWFSVDANLPLSSPMHLEVLADSVPVRDLVLLAQATDTSARGRMNLALRATGPRDAPQIELESAVRDATVVGVHIDSLGARGRYADQKLDADLAWTHAGKRALDATIGLPIDLAFAPRATRLIDAPLSGRIRADSTTLAIAEAFTTVVDSASGRVAVDLSLGGTVKRPLLTGSVQIANGEAHPVEAGDIRLRQMTADLRFLGDSLTIQRLSAVSGRTAADAVGLTGWIAFSDIANPRFDLRLLANEFHGINNRRIADLWVSGDLRLRGSATAATLTGSASVDRGNIYIPELTAKHVVQLDEAALLGIVDTALHGDRAVLPSPPPALVRNLEVRDASIAMGDVWLRSTEANINIGGTVSIDRLRELQGGDSAVRLTLDGTLNAVRGTYRMNLGGIAGFVQRTFSIEDGTIRFFRNEPTLNPTLNINAVHTVRQASVGSRQQDTRIRVTIGGTLAQPDIRFSSADNVALSQSDLISYLVTGSPSFGVNSIANAGNVFLSSIGSAFSDKLSDWTGNWFDYLQLQTAYDPNSANSAQRLSIFAGAFGGTRLGGAKQLMNGRAFLSGNLGLCPFTGLSSGATSDIGKNFINAVGLRIDYRVRSDLFASVGVEPSSSQLQCLQNASVSRGLAQSPQQLGVDLTRRWRF